MRSLRWLSDDEAKIAKNVQVLFLLGIVPVLYVTVVITSRLVFPIVPVVPYYAILIILCGLTCFIWNIICKAVLTIIAFLGEVSLYIVNKNNEEK